MAQARSKVAGAGAIGDKIGSNNGLFSALARLLLVVERYPELKANTNFIRLQDELAGTGNRIAVEKRRFNESVRVFNTKIRSFPTNLAAGIFGFEKADFFQVPKENQEAPRVTFLSFRDLGITGLRNSGILGLLEGMGLIMNKGNS